MEHLPNYIAIIFVITTVISIIWFYLASRSKAFLLIVGLWAILTSVLAHKGLYMAPEFPVPKLGLAIFPSFLLMLGLFLSEKGKKFIRSLDLKMLTFLSVIRIPVEIVLDLLYKNNAISIWQTFEGANFDIISGITAPIIGYMVFYKKKWGEKTLLWWNIICLILLITIVTISTLAYPSGIQAIAFEQPNLAIGYFPYIWLPGIVVPIVMFSHFVAIWRLTGERIDGGRGTVDG